MRTFLLTAFLLCCSVASAEVLQPMRTVSVETAMGHHVWHVELASDDDSRSQGLMFRAEMDAKAGMLFRFDGTQTVSMWMKNTLIPLDMIFIRNDGTISNIAENTIPHSRQIISSTEPVRFVLEINGGQSSKLGLKQGQVMRHPWFKTP